MRFDLPPTDGGESNRSRSGMPHGPPASGEHAAAGSWARSRRSTVAPAITSVTVVSTTTPVRQRAHTVGKYVKGTLSPTAAAATAGASPALLRAARDGDDVLLKDILRRAVLVGIPEKELNTVDSSGRVSLDINFLLSPKNKR